MTADNIGESKASEKACAYALTYGGQSVADALAGIESRAAKASKASKPRKSKTAAARK